MKKTVLVVFFSFLLVFSSSIIAFGELASGYESKATILLGEENGFVAFQNTRSAYGNSYETTSCDMVWVLANAFNTAKLGTDSTQAAIKGLIPESVYSKQSGADAKMSAIYKYFTQGQISRYYTIAFDDNGDPYDVYIPLDNVKRFVNDGIKCGVFKGNFDNFETNPSIKSLDVFCEKMNITKEVAIAFFEILEGYDISWLTGDSTSLLDAFID